MTAPPQIIERALTFHFAPSVNSATGLPDVMEVAVLPLGDASSAPAGATFTGGLRTATVELVYPGPNTAVFDLIPSYTPGLTAPILYRVMWRAGALGRTYTYDFAMPDVDCTWDELITGIGEVIDGEVYLQQSDLGVPGRVARLDDAGHVIDSAGNPVVDSAAWEVLSANLTVEKVERQQAINDLRRTLENEMYVQDSTNLDLAHNYTDNRASAISGDLTVERGARINADDDLQSQITSLTGSTGGAIAMLQGMVDDHEAILPTKADLDGDGKILLSQIPESIAANAFPVPDQAAMLALTVPTVHRGDIAVRPDGIWLLTANDPSQLGNWVSLTTISAVNGKRGNVSLTAADVGAIPTGGSIAQNQVTGLATALGLKANQADLTTVTAQVASILADTTIVHTTGGVIPHGLLDSSMVYLNESGQLVKKDGTIIPVGSGGGGGSVFSVNGKTGTIVLTATDVGAIATGGSISMAQVTGLSAALSAAIPQSQVTGLTAALGAKADLTGGLIPLSEIPSLPTTKITGLASILANNNLDATSNVVNRVATLEGQIVGGGGGGGGGISTQVPFYTSSNISSPVTDFTLVNLHSPWGIDSDGTVTGTPGTWYYEYEGVRSNDVAYPLITANGHLQLRKWNESGPSEPVYALASDLSTLTSTVGTKAAQSDLTALQVTVSAKANQTDLTALSSAVDGKASSADLTNLANTVAGKAAQSSLDSTNAIVATKANQSDLTTLTSTVNTKAASADLATTNSNISTINTTLTHKADLDGSNKVLLAQLPNIPISQTTGLATALAGKADLSAGVLSAAQIPPIPQSSVTGLGTALGAKADLVGGTVPLSQLPQAALPNVQVVNNRAAMLALTGSQVQYGDLALITAGADKGTYVLTGNDPSQFASWTALTTPDAPVTSVNTRTGAVTLTYTDVGAMAANATPAAGSAAPGSTLATQLATFATSASVTSSLATKASYTDVQNMWFQSSMVKHADYVATSNIASLSMQQSADGVLMPNNAIVLLTAQSDSTVNGLWTVSSSGAWTRPADYAVGSFIGRDSVVMVANTTASANGSTNPYTVWQMTTSSGVIGTNVTSWTKIGYCAPTYVPAQGNGIAITGNTFAAKVASTSSKNGILLASEGLYLDPNLAAKKYTTANPSTSTVQSITHSLNNWFPTVSIWDTSSHTLVLAGVQATSADTISIEFGSAPSVGQYTITVVG